MVNVLSSRKICLSRRDTLFCFSLSIVYDMLACRPFRKLQCRDSNVVPNFLNFLVISQPLKAFLTYRQYQLNLLQEEIRHKKSDIRFLKKEFNSSHSALQN